MLHFRVSCAEDGEILSTKQNRNDALQIPLKSVRSVGECDLYFMLNSGGKSSEFRLGKSESGLGGGSDKGRAMQDRELKKTNALFGQKTSEVSVEYLAILTNL